MSSIARGAPRSSRVAGGLAIAATLALALASAAPASATATKPGKKAAPKAQAEHPGVVLRPAKVRSTSGTVTGARNLVTGHGTATLTMAPGGTAPAIVLDYGHDVGGVPRFQVSAVSGSPSLQAIYSESMAYLLPGGDGAPSFGNANADPSRVDTYQVTRPGLIDNHLVQGGERFERISLTGPGTLTLRLAAIDLTSTPQYTATRRSGAFLSSDRRLNEIWQLGANAVSIDSVPAGSEPPVWSVSANGTTIPYSGPESYQAGGTWTDYSESFQGEIVANELAWIVRYGTTASSATLTLDSHDDALGTPDTLVVNQSAGFGAPPAVMSFPVPFTVPDGTFLPIVTTVKGSTLTVSVNGTTIATVPVISSSGSIGFSNANGAQALVKDLSVTGPAGQAMYSNPMTSAGVLQDFAAGTNALPVVIDGAKRDRLVWGGDAIQAAPAVYDTSDAGSVIRGSLEQWGSYPTSAGEAGSDLPTALAPGLTSGDNLDDLATGHYSLSYSEIWPINLYQYYLYTGDLGFVRREWPVVQAEMQYLKANTDAHGLVVTTAANGNDWALDQQTGEVTEYNNLYYAALRSASLMAAALGQHAVAVADAGQADAVKAAINTYLLDPSTGLYEVSTDKHGVVVQDANSTAVLYGIAPARQAASILAKMNAALTAPTHGNGPEGFSDGVSGGIPFTSDPAVISPFMSAFQADADFAIGKAANALSLIRTVWGHMLPGHPFYSGDTFEEMGLDGRPAQTNSLAHAWGAGATSALSQYVLGAQPLTAGYRSWLVAPQTAGLRFASGRVPTPHGPLSVNWAVGKRDRSFALSVTAPARTSGAVAVPQLGRGRTITEDGRIVWSRGRHAHGVAARRVGATVVFAKVRGKHTFAR